MQKLILQLSLLSKKVTAKNSDSANTSYDVEGDLTIKDKTNTITFPATIKQEANGQVVAEATTKIDRTKWGLTAGSASFFDNLADNAIDDMIELSFKLVANKQQFILKNKSNIKTPLRGVFILDLFGVIFQYINNFVRFVYGIFQ